jgi:2-keto-4-pentenoate hydratase
MTGVSLTVTTLAAALAQAEATRIPISALTEGDPALTIADAYAIQEHNTSRRQAAGARLLGRKVGLTSKAMQEMLAVTEPDFGALLDDMFVEEGDDVDLDALIAPRVEGELAFVLKHDLVGPGVTAVTAGRACAGAIPALEIIDSRIADWKIRLPDTIADNASSARVVLGGALTPLGSFDPRLVGMALDANGETIATGAGAAVLGNPLRCVAWLANQLAEFGTALRAGEVVLAGALHGAIDVHDGDVVRAEFAHLGAVTARFSGRGGR